MRSADTALVGNDKKIEYFIMSVSFAFLISSAIFYFAPASWWPDFYRPMFFSITSLMAAILINLPKALVKTQVQCRRKAVMYLRLVIVIALLLHGFGELYLFQLYKIGFQYDKVLHLANSFLFVMVFSVFMEMWLNIPYRRALAFAAAATLAGGLLWEVSEYFSDIFLKTLEFGNFGQDKFSDTLFDIIFDLLGTGIAYNFLNNPKQHEKIVNQYCNYPQTTYRV